MELTARAIHEKQFNDAWRGYSQEEVDDFLDRVAEAIDQLDRESRALRERVGELDQAVAASRDTEEMLKKTLVSAQRAAEEAIGAARAKAEVLITEAERRAREASEEAGRQIAQAEKEHEIRRRQLDASIGRLRAFEADLKQRLKVFLDKQIETLGALDDGVKPRLRAAAGPPADATKPPLAQAAGERTITLHPERTK